MRSKSQLISNKALKLPSNRKIYALAEAHYRFHDCLTWTRNYSFPDYEYFIELNRKVSKIKNMDLSLMPGFRFTWKYNHNVEPEAKYSDDDTTKQFAR